MPENRQSLRNEVECIQRNVAGLRTDIALITQKLDFLVAGFVDDRAERKESCNNHLARIKQLERWSIVVTAGGGVLASMLVYLKEEIKGKLGIR